MNLSANGLRERFDILLHDTERPPSNKAPTYGPREVVRDLLVFNVDAWPTHSSDLMEYGREEVQRSSNWFTVALERAGCNNKNINEQWVSLKIQVNS